jgi:protein phosphatase
MARFSCGGKTDPGRVRQQNEDALLILPDRGLFIVADGMGGHNAGEIASALAVDSVNDSLNEEKLRAISGNAEEIHHSLIGAFNNANALVMEKAAEEDTLSGMGCTLVVALLDGSALHVCHAGDARCYLADADHLMALTHDDAAANELTGGFKNGGFGASIPRNIITMAVGFPFPHDPEYQVIPIESGQKIILCSDGLWSMLDDAKIQSLLQMAADPEEAAERLVEGANEAGGKDNITALVVFF